LVDLIGRGDAQEESEDDNLLVKLSDNAEQQGDDSALPNIWAPLGVWDDEDDEMDERNDVNDADMRLPKVLKAFQSLKVVFDGRFKRIWA
jgi:hypothetical protein